MKSFAGLVGAALLSGCGGNQPLLVSGGERDFVVMARIAVAPIQGAHFEANRC